VACERFDRQNRSDFNGLSGTTPEAKNRQLRMSGQIYPRGMGPRKTEGWCSIPALPTNRSSGKL
jgi:hypothetical protein